MRVKAYAGTWAHRTSAFLVCAGARPTYPWVWVLSQSTRDRMETQLTREQCLATNTSAEPIFDNPGKLKSIDDRALLMRDFPREAGRMFFGIAGDADRLTDCVLGNIRIETFTRVTNPHRPPDLLLYRPFRWMRRAEDALSLRRAIRRAGEVIEAAPRSTVAIEGPPLGVGFGLCRIPRQIGCQRK